MSDKSGRKPSLTMEEISNIIFWFRNEVLGSPNGTIKAAPIHEFTQRLYEEGRIGKPPSLDFWYKPNRLGAIALAEAIRVFDDPMPKRSEDVVVPRVRDLARKKYKSQEELITNFLPLEKVALRLEDRVQSLTKKLKDRDKEIVDWKKLKAKNLDLEELIFNLFRYIQDESTNPKTKEITHEALVKIYTDPMCFYKRLESEHQLARQSAGSQKKDNTVKLSDRLKSRLVSTNPKDSN